MVTLRPYQNSAFSHTAAAKSFTEQRDFDEDYSIVAAHIQCMVTNGGKILGPRAFDTHKQEGKASNKHQVALSWSRGSIFG
jgi:hypothetical protein